MLKLNLANQDKSDIKYTISNYPDGQQDITIKAGNFKFVSDLNSVGNWNVWIEIQSRFNNFNDLELILCATKALRQLGVKNIVLYIPYLLGARSDRKFTEGGLSYLVEVIAPIINAQAFYKVRVMDVHSDVAAACINNLEIVDNYNLVTKSLNVILN